MGKKWKQLLSFLLIAAMILSLGVSGFAAGLADESAEEQLEEGETPILNEEYEEGEDSQTLPMEEYDPAALGVQKLGLIEEDAEELTPMDEVDLNKVVRVSIFLDAPSTLDAGFAQKGIANNQAAIAYRDGLLSEQDLMTAEIEAVIGHALNVHWNLTLAVNAISADLSLAEMVRVEALPGVASVKRENLYLAQEDSAADPNTANTSRYMVGATAAWAAGYTGAGSRIAIIDTGLDTSHQSFNEDAFNHAISEVNAQRTANGLELVELMETIPNGLNGQGVRISAKIPYAYNYIDKNTTVTHLNDSQGEHGSHVAGIAAANRYIKSGSSYNDAAASVYAVGMAPDAQLLVMKVFGENGGAYDSDYMVAIEDAILLDADAANLSLGSASPGFTYDSYYQDVLNKLAARAKNEGMVVTISAGNSGAFTDNTPTELYAEDISWHTGGTPGTFVNSLCVASADNIGNTGMPLVFNGSQNVFYTDGSKGPAMSSVAESYSYVYIDAPGNPEDYSTVNSTVSLSGKIVIVNRGSINFSDKGNNAIAFSPKALIVANNQGGTIGMTLDDYTGSFPMVSITLADAETIKANSTSGTTGGITYYTGTVEVTNTVSSGGSGSRENAAISDFSSWGVPGSLVMKPEITAPGGSIYSVYGTNKDSNDNINGGDDQYELMSGTSMAAPHVAGLAAVVAQYLRDNDLSAANSALTAKYSTRAIIQSLLMSTATPMKNGGLYLPVLQQGAGLAEVCKAVTASTVLMMNNAGMTTELGSAADGKVKVELGDDPGRVGQYSFSYTLYNITDTDLSFELRTDLFTQAIDGENLSRLTTPLAANVSYAWNGSGSQPAGHDVNRDDVTNNSDVQAILDYLSGENDGSRLDLAAGDMDGDGTLTTQDAQQLIDWQAQAPAGGYVVAAHGSAEVTVYISILEGALSGRPNGAYIEGFSYAECVTSDAEGVSYAHTHSIPILGYYGSWTDPSMFDTKSYTEKLYGSEQENYSGVVDTNYLTLDYNGVTAKFSGNPYMVEKEFPADRLAVNSSSKFGSIFYNMIRAAGTTGFAVSKIYALQGDVDKVLSATVTGNDVLGCWYYTNQGTWQNTGTMFYSVNKSAADFGLAEGDSFRIGYYAIPEYNALVNAANPLDGNAGHLDDAGLSDVIESNDLGHGAFVGYDFTVDNTDPQITAATLTGSTLSITASDNLNLAYVAVMSLDGETKYDEQAPGQSTFTISLNASDAIANAQGYVAVFAADYAGNEVARAVKVNENAYADKVVYVLSDGPAAGNEYVVANINAAGSGYIVGHTDKKVNSQLVTVRPAANGIDAPYIDSADVNASSVWTASVNDSGNYLLKNGSNYLGRNSNNGRTLSAPTNPSYGAWTYNSNSLSMTIKSTFSTNTYYLGWSGSSFTLSETASNTYFFVKTTVRTEIDPYVPTDIRLTPESLDLYKGNTASLVAKVLPLTAEDRTVSWSSSDDSVATVDDFGNVTAVGAGSCTITATANGDPGVSKSVDVNVLAVNKTLNGIIWDEQGGVYFSFFNANSLPTWTKSSSTDKELPLTSAFMQSSSTLYAGTLDSSTAETTLYTVNRSSYALTEVGQNYVYATDMAIGASNSIYAAYVGFVYTCAYNLVAGPLEPKDYKGGTYTGVPEAALDCSETTGGAYFAGIACKSRSADGGTYYVLDENGVIWTTTLNYSARNGFEFSTPTKFVETGISTSFLYQNLYYDGTYLYWTHTDGEFAELIIIRESDKKIYHAGNFGSNVWPATGLYVNGSVAPASVEEPAELEADLSGLQPLATREELLTEDIVERMTLMGFDLSGYFTDASEKEEVLDENELPLDEEPIETEEPVETEEPFETEEPVETEVPSPAAEEGEGGQSAFGSLTAFRGAYAPASAEPNASGEAETSADNTVTITLSESVLSKNGLFTVTYDPAVLTYVSCESSLSYKSVHADSGTITFAYADRDGVAANSPIAALHFKTTGAKTTATISTTQRNGELNLTESETVTVGESSYVHTNSSDLRGQIELRFYVHISEAALADPDAYAVLTLNDREVTTLISAAPTSTSGGVLCRRFKIPVKSKEMRDEVVLRLYDGNGNLLPLKDKDGVDVTSSGYVYTLMQYFKVAQEKGSAKMKALAVAAENYGTAAQLYFKHKADGLAAADAVTEVTLAEFAPFAPVYEGTLPEAVIENTSTLELNSDNTLRQYFSLKSGTDLSTLTFTVDGKTVTPVKRGNLYCTEVANISADKLDVAHVFTVSDGVNTYTITFSALSYGYRALTSSAAGDNIKNLVKALYLYNQAANAYFD